MHAEQITSRKINFGILWKTAYIALVKKNHQFAALPYRPNAKSTKVCMITSRETGRWIVPKGWPQRGMEPNELARLEALEEAGLVGKVESEPIGSFRYPKILKDGSEVDCTVTVFPMLVTKEKKTWPEMRQREKRWLKIEKAAELAGDDGLSTLLLDFAGKIKS